MKNKKLFKLSAIILGIITLCSFSKIQAVEDIFGETDITRNAAQPYARTTFSNYITLGISAQRESGNAYTWNHNTTVDKKTVWKIVDRNNLNSRDLYYCLNATRGFNIGSNGEMNPELNDDYTTSFDMKDSNDKSNIINYAGGKLGDNYNKVLWILENSYMPTGAQNYQTSLEYKSLMQKAEIQIDSSDERLNLTEDDIEVVQQMAIWYFTNSDNSNYSNDNLPTLYLNGEQLTSLSIQSQDGPIRVGSIRDEKAKKLYQYFTTNSSSVVTPTLELTNTNAQVIESGNYFIAGPFVLSKTNLNISDVVVKLNNTELSNTDYTLVATTSSNTNITNYDSLNTFYFKINKDKITQDSNISIQAKGVYSTKDLTFMTNPSDKENTQPVVLVEQTGKQKNDATDIDIELEQITVNKIWVDSDNQDGKRPTSVKVQLYKNSSKYGDSVTLNQSNNWTHTWNKLLSGSTYTVKELNSSNSPVADNSKYNNDYTAKYEVSNNITNITNKHVPETTSVSGTKTWSDNNNQDGKRPTSITVNLFANGEKVNSKTVNATAQWKYTFTNLPKYENGQVINYTIDEETVSGYQKTISGYNITNKYIPETIDIPVTKTWSDNNNQDGKRPTSITVNLFANGEKVTSKEVKSPWTHEFTNLPKYEDGKVINYTITEDAVNGYKTTIDGYKITNKYTPETINISGTKTWDDSNNQDGKRPESITIELFANGEKVTSKEVKSPWTYEFTNLPKYENGQVIKYTIDEETVSGYKKTIDGYDITNEYTPETINIPVIKIWEDSDNQDGKRPESITVNLFANGKKVKSKEVKSPWTYEFTNLPKYEDGKVINYTITEDEVSEYKTTIDGYKITNKYTPETISISGTKTWDDSNNQDGKRPESITIELFANNEKVNSTTVNEEAQWKYTFTDLPKYENGQVIDYTIDEELVSGYDKKINGYDITNKYTPGKTSKKVIKVWDDEENSDEIRPTDITVELYKLVDGEEITVDTKKLNESNNWKHTWTDLEEKANGENIVYGIKEINSIPGYVTSYSIENHLYNEESTITITNKHVPNKIDVEVQKVDEEGKNITSSETKFNINSKENTTIKGIVNLNSQKLIENSFEFNYTIKETKAPIGYIGISEDLTVKISGTTKIENGKYLINTINITDKDGNQLNSEKILAEYNEQLNKVIIKIVNRKIENSYSVQLIKVGEDNETPIEGSWFEIDGERAILVSADGIEIATGTLNNENEINLTYNVEETTAPNGYVKINGVKEVKIKATVELVDSSYEIKTVNLLEEIEGITVSEENNIITIKVKNEPEITGEYDIILRKVDENGNKLLGSKFTVSGTEYDLSTGEFVIRRDIPIESESDIDLEYVIQEIQIPEGYNGIESTEVKIKAKVQKIGNNYKLTRANLVDGEGNNITNENISIQLEGQSIVIVVKNTPVNKKFDLALRKFITKVNEVEYSREPVVDTSTIATGTATYKHIKQPIPVQKGDVVTYTIRVYNEGQVDGYVNKITDHLPTNLLPILSTVDGIDTEKYENEIKFNEDRLWQQIDDARTVFTTITSKSNSELYSEYTGLENITDTKLEAYVEGSNELDYIDVQIKCLVADTATSYEYLTNIAEITDAEDIEGVVGNGEDSILGNAIVDNLSDYKNEEAINSTTNSYIEGQEDDDDFEKIVVKEFDLSLRKYITKVNEVMHAREPVVDTSKLGTVIDGKTITTATYNHPKDRVIVKTGDVVTYKIRIYNEGTLEGFANEITDNIPEGLEFIVDSEINDQYEWKMLDSEGEETEEIVEAVKVVTNYLSDANSENKINHVTEEDGEKVLDYKDVEIQFKVVAEPENLQDNVIINEAQISDDSDRDIDSDPKRDEKYDYINENNEDDIDYEPIKLQYFDLALRKFITKVNSTNYNNRYPEVKYNEDGSITYTHTKDPVLVTTNDTVVYTIRVYNEGEIAGYATEIKDNLPEGLAFDPENEINKQYNWKMLDSEGNVIEDASKVTAFSTDYLKDKLIDPLKNESNGKILSYEDVQIAFKVVEANTSDRILVNTAQISNDSDDDIDSTPNNNIETEDDLDKEYIRVQYFDLSLKKWVTRTEVTYDGKTTTTKTEFDEDTDKIAKVDLVAKKMTKTTVKFAYNIKVTNEGELPGYAYEVKDYIPKGLKFVAEDNKDWKELEDGTVVTEKLKDTLLNPGESAIVEIVLTWKNSTTNTGLKTNYAEISKDSAEDKDSIPDNYDFTEDDMDDAQVILSIKTAGAPTYIGLVLITVTILAGGILLIKKYVID